MTSDYLSVIYSDRPVIQEFKELLKRRAVKCDGDRIIDEPVISVQSLLSQLRTTDFVVATRFHNVLLALIMNKPVLSISFHQKCASLMSDMELSAYCQDIKELTYDWLMSRFGDLETNSLALKASIKQKTERFREALDEQYNCIFRDAPV